MRSLSFGLAGLAAVAACGGDPATTPPDAAPDANADACARVRAPIEARMTQTLMATAANTALSGSPDFTVLLETREGARFVHESGASTATTVYESASTSKWVTAAVILDLVDQGTLSLTSDPSTLLTFWATPGVTLRDLLSFTSGCADEPLCLNLPGASFASCVETIYDNNVGGAPAPGTVYDYASTHMQVAGLMAIRAAGVASWSEVFDAWRTRTGLFPTGAYDLPSATNPRLAGGMHWQGEEYLAFLRAVARGTLLAPATHAAMLADQRGAAIVPNAQASPVFSAVGEDWSYGLGNWLECPTATALNSFDCGAGHRNSSAGAYGAYPFFDQDAGYFGLVARQGGLATAREGLAIFRTIEADAAAWATACTVPI